MKIAIIGYGVWGKALAKILSYSNLSVIVWSRYANPSKDNNCEVTNNMSAITDVNLILMVIPAQNMRSVCHKLLKLNIDPNIPIIICSKGIECNTVSLMSEVISEILSHKAIAAISGPNFAHEIIAGLPSSSSLACCNQDLLLKIQSVLNNDNLILHPNLDLIGTQIFGAVKNVIAIACGIFDGKGLGQNAKSSLITKGLKEIQSLCITKGGKAETALELCGIGDLLLTCSSQNSRNVSLGHKLAKGISYQGILSQTKEVMEGAYTSKAVYFLAKKLKVSMPISKIIYDILYENKSIEVAVNEMTLLI